MFWNDHGKYDIDTEKEHFVADSQPSRLFHTAQSRPGYLLFLLYNASFFQSRLYIQMWRAVLEKPCDHLTIYQEISLAEIEGNRCSNESMLVKTVSKMWGYCIFSGIFSSQEQILLSFDCQQA